MNYGALFLVLLLSATKFLFAPSLALSSFNVWESILIVFLGGSAGITFFYLAADWVMDRIAQFQKQRDHKKQLKGIVVVRKVFTPFRRKVIRIKNKFGLLGIAIVTPCIISIPIGSVLAAKFFKNKIKVLTYMYTSAAFWAVFLTLLNNQVLALIKYLFG